MISTLRQVWRAGRQECLPHNPARTVLPLVLALAAPGCTWLVRVPPLDPLPRRKAVLRDVAYTPQTEDWDCGPACLTTLMRHYGSDLTLERVKGQLKQKTGGGVIIVEMIFGARRNGFPIEMYEGGLNDLRRKVAAGRPLILLLHPLHPAFEHTGRRRAHYVVAVGYDDDRRRAILHTGERAFVPVSYRRLQQQWRRTEFITLLVRRPPTAVDRRSYRLNHAMAGRSESFRPPNADTTRRHDPPRRQ
jgi:predicted double-glycine peptidase